MHFLTPASPDVWRQESSRLFLASSYPYSIASLIFKRSSPSVHYFIVCTELVRKQSSYSLIHSHTQKKKMPFLFWIYFSYLFYLQLLLKKICLSSGKISFVILLNFLQVDSKHFSHWMVNLVFRFFYNNVPLYKI